MWSRPAKRRSRGILSICTAGHMKAQNSFTARSLFITLTIKLRSVPYLKILTPLSLPSWNERIGGSPLNAVVSGLPHNTSSLREGQPIKAKSPSSSKMRLFARLRWSKLAKGIGGLYWSPETSKAVIFMSSCVSPEQLKMINSETVMSRAWDNKHLLAQALAKEKWE